MVSNNDIYSKLQSYTHTLDDYIEHTKKHPDEVRASPAFGDIFRDIQAINGIPENTAGLASDAARQIFPTRSDSAKAPEHNKALKREIRHLNKSIVSAKYQEEVQGKNWLQRIPVWFKYHFSSPEKLGIARLDVRHLVNLMKAANVKTSATIEEKLIKTDVRSDSEAFNQLNDVVQKLGPAAANGTYLLLEDKSGLYIIETEGNQAKFAKYTFKNENGLCAVFDSHKNRVGTFTDRESFLKQKQVDAAIAYIKDPKITVEKDRSKYLKIETGRTKEGKEITLVLKNSDGLVATNQYILPNGITPLVNGAPSGSYFNREEFFQAKAKELHVPFIISTVASGHADAVGTVEEARKELENKPAGSWTSTLKDAKSEAVFLIVVDNKNTIKEFTFKEMPNKEPEAIRPFLEAATTTQIPATALVSFVPISAQKKRIAQGEALKRIIVEGDITQSNLAEAMNEADKATQGKASFVIKAVPGKLLTEFTITARPDKSNSFDSNNRLIKVLPDGRIQHDKGRIFENFETYKAAEQLSTSLPEALIQRHLGAPVLKAPTDLPANTYVFWADKENPSKLYLSNKTAAGIETYQLGNMKFDNTGKATFQLQGKNGNIVTKKESELAKPFGDAVLSSQQREVIGRLSEFVAKERIKKTPATLLNGEPGYLLTAGNSPSTYNFTVYGKGGMFSTPEDKFILRVLPDGKIAKESKDGVVEPFSDMTTFQNAVTGLAGKKSVKDLSHFDKVGEAIAKAIRGHVENIIKPTLKFWPQTEPEARALMEEAKTLELPQNQAIFVRLGADSPRITVLFQRDGALHAMPCDVQQDGKLVVTVPQGNATTTYNTIDDVLKANVLVKAETIQTQIAEKRAIIQAGIDKLKATDGFDPDNIVATKITEALTSHIEEFPSMDAMVGAWMLAQVVDITPAYWFFQSDTIKETGRFKLAVNVGDKEEDIKIVEHTISVNSKGEFILDGDTTKPKKTIDEVLTSVGAKKD
ncbi:MAG: hypothetical protein LLF94_08400, partial [Chlamydiales bacterium]|nr:hypothetical protein [Chlamydiales bacterium]